MSRQEIGETICWYRKLNSLTQAKLGKILGYSQRTISDWEKGNTEPNIEAIRKIAEFFDITYDELIGH